MRRKEREKRVTLEEVPLNSSTFNASMENSRLGEQLKNKPANMLTGLGGLGGKGGDMGEIFVYSQLKHVPPQPPSIVLTCSEVRHAV